MAIPNKKLSYTLRCCQKGDVWYTISVEQNHVEPCLVLSVEQRPRDMHIKWKPSAMPVDCNFSPRSICLVRGDIVRKPIPVHHARDTSCGAELPKKPPQPSRLVRTPSICILKEISCQWWSIGTMPQLLPTTMTERVFLVPWSPDLDFSSLVSATCLGMVVKPHRVTSDPKNFCFLIALG